METKLSNIFIFINRFNFIPKLLNGHIAQSRVSTGLAISTFNILENLQFHLLYITIEKYTSAHCLRRCLFR